ncbi:MAG TPA: PASTA domain-containing protein [Gaiellaceae bacterium]|nr:PASTA domain-containing protein [Gaiellaceae bacterium]
MTSSPAGIDCGATCSAQFADGTAVTLTAAAAGAGLTFDAWDGDCSGSGTCVLTIDRDRAVTAVFVEYFRPGLPAHCHVPKVVGMLLRKAVVRITHAHCRPGRVIRRPSSKARKNHVLAQTPKPGRTLIQGRPVNLTVGKGPKKK